MKHPLLIGSACLLALLSTIGASLAWTPTDAFEAAVTYGHALKDVAVPNDGSVQDKGVHFRIIAYPLRFRP